MPIHRGLGSPSVPKPRSTPRSPKPPRSCNRNRCCSASRPRCPAVSVSASPLAGRLSTIRICCCLTNRCRTLTPNCGCRPASKTELHQTLGNTIIYVTHDQTEAMTLADRIVVLRAGRIEQVGPLMVLYDGPHNIFVAGSIGSSRMNFLAATETASGLQLGTVTTPLPTLSSGLVVGQISHFGIRPELMGPVSGVTLPGTVAVVEKLGSTALVYCRLDGGETVVPAQRETGAPPVSRLNLHFDISRARLFDTDGIRIHPQRGGRRMVVVPSCDLSS